MDNHITHTTRWENIPFVVGEREPIKLLGTDRGKMIIVTRYGNFKVSRPKNRTWKGAEFGKDIVIMKLPTQLTNKDPIIHTYKYEIQGDKDGI